MSKAKIQPVRHSEADIKNCIFRPKDVAAKAEVAQKEPAFYTMFGEKGGEQDDEKNTVVSKDSPFVYAKKLVSANSFTYWIKTDSTGFYNPQNIYANKSQLARDLSGASQNKFTRVNKAAFELYLKFLKTKNELYLKNALKENY